MSNPPDAETQGQLSEHTLPTRESVAAVTLKIPPFRPSAVTLRSGLPRSRRSSTLTALQCRRPILTT